MRRRAAVVCALLLLAARGWSQATPAAPPQLVVQTGHAKDVTAAIFTPDSRALVTGSEDGTVKIWDVATGAELRALRAGDEVKAIALSPDGRTVAAAAGRNAFLWDLTSGALLRTFSDSSQIFSLAFHPKGGELVTGSDQFKVWNLASGQETSSLPLGAIGQITCLAFSRDAKYLATGGNDDSLRIWDAANGTVLYRLQGFKLGCLSVAFDPESTLVAYSAGDGSVGIWDVAAAKELHSISGARIGEVEGTESVPRTVVTLSADGKWLIGARDPGFKGSGGLVLIWEVATAKPVRVFRAQDPALHCVAFSPDGRWLATGGGGATAQLWAMADNLMHSALEGHAEGIDQPDFSPDGRSLAVFSLGHQGNERIASPIQVWDLAAGEGYFQLSGGFMNLGMAISADSRKMATTAADGGLRFWNLVQRGAQGGGAINGLYPAVAFSPDGNSVAVGGDALVAVPGKEEKEDDFAIRRWDMTTGKSLPRLEGHSGTVVALAFSPKGDRLASASSSAAEPSIGSALGPAAQAMHSAGASSIAIEGKFSFTPPGDQTLRIWDLASAKELLRVSGLKENISRLAYSPDGRILAAGYGNDVQLYDAATGSATHALRGHTAPVVMLAFSADGRTLASSSEDHTVRFWDLATGEARVVPIEGGVVRSIRSDFGLLAGASGTSLDLYDPATGKLLLTLTALDQQDWLAVTPDGLFDGSPRAWKRILWRFNNDTFDAVPVELFFGEYFYPGLVADIAAGKRPTAASSVASRDRRQPQLKLGLAEGAAETAVPTRQVTVRIEVQEAAADAQHPAGSGVRDLRLFRNGSLVSVWRGQLPLDKDGKAALQAKVTLVAGDNRLTAYAFNHDNIKSADATLTLTGAESQRRQGTAYILAVGINHYANPDYDLRYAVADAQDFSAELQAQQAKLRRYAAIEIVPMLDAQATRENLLWALHRLGGAAGTPPAGAPQEFSRLQPAQPEDAVFVYYAGHGTAAGPRFYLIPHDLGYTGPREQLDEAALASILQHSVSDLDLQQAFETIDAGELLLVIDACNSGQALESEEKRRGPMNSQGLAQLAYEKGMYILTASQGYQSAQEVSRYGHGLLTYALVEQGLKAAQADSAPKDGQILLREWLDFASQQVPELQLGLMQDARGRGTEVAIVEGEEKMADLEKRSLQRPRVFYRREPEVQPLVVAKP